MASKLMDIIEVKIKMETENNKQNYSNEQNQSCKTIIGNVCMQLYKECTNLDTEGQYLWWDVERADNGQSKCADEPCHNPISGEISDNILQTAGEMFTYIVACPTQERDYF